MTRVFASGAIAVIINTGARAGQDVDADAIRRAFAAHGRQSQINAVQGSQIADVVRSSLADGARIVVAAGGDGTVNAVAAELVGRDDAALAVLPVGTLNHFARDLGMPSTIEDAVAMIAQGRARTIDTGDVNGRIFLNNSSIGLYARLVVERERLQRRSHLHKWSAMMRAGGSVLRHWHLFSATLCVDGRELHRRAPFVFVGNNDYVIEGMRSGQRNRLDAGVLSIYVPHQSTFKGLSLLAMRAMAGRVVRDRDLERLYASSLSVEAHGSRIEVARDGEVDVLDTPLRYRIRPHSLNVIAPVAGGTA